MIALQIALTGFLNDATKVIISDYLTQSFLAKSFPGFRGFILLCKNSYFE